jgi:hypothetical protein
MRGLHAGVLFLQGVPIIIGTVLAVWIAYYARAAVIELRTIRLHLAWVRYHLENPPGDAPKDKAGP